MADFRFVPPAFSAGDLILVLTQSCDLLYQAKGTDEDVEILILRRVAVSDGNYTHGKHPRIFHCSCTCEEHHAFEVHTRERNFIERTALNHAIESTTCGIAHEDVSVVAFWFGRRYFRSAFPEAFAGRISRKQQKALRKLIKGTHDLVTGIYLRLRPEEELPDKTPYHVSIYVTVDPEDWDVTAIRVKAIEFATALAAVINSKDIVVDDAEAMSEAALDIHTVSNSLRYDEFDYLSFGTDESEEQF